VDAHTFEEFYLGTHLMSGCLPCADAQRWSAMCETGKTLYDNMIAAQYAAEKEDQT